MRRVIGLIDYRKTLAAFVLSLVMILFIPVAIGEESELFTSGSYRYSVLDDGTISIKKYTGEEDTIEIPYSIDGYTVTAIGDEAFFFCSSLTSITIPESVTFIGVNPWVYCDKLQTIKISLDHPVLAAIDGVLYSKPDKRLICFPCSYTQSSFTIPNGIKIIGDQAFSCCSSLTSITIPDSLASIGDAAFIRCSSLTSITIPDSVTNIGTNPWVYCNKLQTIQVSPDHPVFATINGVLYSKSDKRLVCYPCSYTQTSFTIPNGIKIIGDRAFFDCSSLTSITIPDSVTSIGDQSFSCCSSLTSITIPDSVTSIGDSAFFSCSNLTSITIPDSVTFIDDFAFSSCSNLTSITIPDSVTSIGDGAFSYCSSLTNITIPDSVTSIGKDAFYSCRSLTSIIVGRDSYARQYCIDNNLPYTYADANSWLND